MKNTTLKAFILVVKLKNNTDSRLIMEYIPGFDEVDAVSVWASGKNLSDFSEIKIKETKDTWKSFIDSVSRSGD
jgi:hypothetical protein